MVDIVQEYFMTNVEAKLDRDEEAAKKTAEVRKKVLIDRMNESCRNLVVIRLDREELLKKRTDNMDSFFWWMPKNRRARDTMERELEILDYQESKEKNQITDINEKLSSL